MLVLHPAEQGRPRRAGPASPSGASPATAGEPLPRRSGAKGYRDSKRILSEKEGYFESQRLN